MSMLCRLFKNIFRLYPFLSEARTKLGERRVSARRGGRVRRKAFSTARFVIDAIGNFKYRPPTMAVFSRARQLQRLVAKIERLITGGAALSSRFTTYRLAIFIARGICARTP